MQKVKFYLNIHVLSIILLCLLLWNKLESLERVLFSSLIIMFLVILIFRPSQYSVYNCIVALWISYISAWMHKKFSYNVYWILRKNLYHDYNVVMSNRLLFSSHHLLSIFFFFWENLLSSWMHAQLLNGTLWSFTQEIWWVKTLCFLK